MSNFFPAFYFIPPQKRKDLFQLYQILKEIDTCADTDNSNQKLNELKKMVMNGEFSVLKKYNFPPDIWNEFFYAMFFDAENRKVRNMDEFLMYINGAGGAVGALTYIITAGALDETSKEYAYTLGCAFQITNILRDFEADAKNGRCYIPLELIEKYGIEEAKKFIYKVCLGYYLKVDEFKKTLKIPLAHYVMDAIYRDIFFSLNKGKKNNLKISVIKGVFNFIF